MANTPIMACIMIHTSIINILGCRTIMATKTTNIISNIVLRVLDDDCSFLGGLVISWIALLLHNHIWLLLYYSFTTGIKTENSKCMGKKIYIYRAILNRITNVCIKIALFGFFFEH